MNDSFFSGGAAPSSRPPWLFGGPSTVDRLLPLVIGLSTVAGFWSVQRGWLLVRPPRLVGVGGPFIVARCPTAGRPPIAFVGRIDQPTGLLATRRAGIP